MSISQSSFSLFSPSPWKAAPYRIEPGANEEDFGSWAVYDARTDCLPIAILDHRNDAHVGFRKSVGDRARLIAAAPDLLEIVRELCEYVGGMHHETYQMFMKRASEALAKAEGGL